MDWQIAGLKTARDLKRVRVPPFRHHDQAAKVRGRSPTVGRADPCFIPNLCKSPHRFLHDLGNRHAPARRVSRCAPANAYINIIDVLPALACCRFPVRVSHVERANLGWHDPCDEQARTASLTLGFLHLRSTASVIEHAGKVDEMDDAHRTSARAGGVVGAGPYFLLDTVREPNRNYVGRTCQH